MAKARGVGGLLDLGARVVEVDEQATQQVLEVGPVEVCALGVDRRVLEAVQEGHQRAAHLRGGRTVPLAPPLHSAPRGDTARWHSAMALRGAQCALHDALAQCTVHDTRLAPRRARHAP